MSETTYGHNKYQITIQELNNTINSMKNEIIEKDNELNIFKDNFISLQNNLKEIYNLTQQYKLKKLSIKNKEI